MLDDFDAVTKSEVPDGTETSMSESLDKDKGGAEESAEDPLSDEFVEELTKNMETFMEHLGKHMSDGKEPKLPPRSPSTSHTETSGGAPPAEDELMKQFEKLLTGNMEGLDKGTSDDTSAQQAEPPSEKSFQDAVQATMNKLRQSNASANTKSKGADDPLAALGLDGNADISKMLEALSQPGEDGEASLSKMLAQMMEELMNKDVLYEPLKDMHSRFPSYLASSEADSIDTETREKYVSQLTIMGDILAVFESPQYSDSNLELRKKVSDLVSRLQDLGTPPQELLGDMPPELAGINNMLGDGGDENGVLM